MVDESEDVGDAKMRITAGLGSPPIRPFSYNICWYLSHMIHIHNGTYIYIYIHLPLGSNFAVNVGKFYQFHGASYGKWGAPWLQNRPRHWIPCLLHQHWRLGNSHGILPQGWHFWTPPFLCKQQKDGWMWFVLSFLNIFTRIQDFFNIILSVFQEFFWLGNFWHPQILKLFGVDDI